MTLSQLLYNMKEQLGMPDYTKVRSYRVAIRVRITNRGKKSCTAELVIPIPQETHNQHVEDEYFSHEVTIVHDGRFGNRIGYLTYDIVPGEPLEVSLSFRVTIAPRHVTIPKLALVSAYMLSTKDHTTYLAHNPILESSDAKRLSQSASLRQKNVPALVRAFNTYVIEHFTYGNPIKGLYSAQDAFQKRTVDCGGFDAAFCALCIASGIPARIVAGFWANGTSDELMHAWCECMLPDGTWVPADPSIEYLVREGRDRTRSGRLGFVGSDRITFSIGCAIPLTNGTTADILQHPFLFEEDDLSLASGYAAERL